MLIDNEKKEGYQVTSYDSYDYSEENSEEVGIKYIINFDTGLEKFNPDFSYHFFSIEFYKYSTDEKSLAIFNHPTFINVALWQKHCEEQFTSAENFFQACQSWSPEQGLGMFLENVGCIAFCLAKNQFALYGNAAITEWLFYGLAKKKNIELGPFSTKSNISWDYKAFVTSDMKAYAKWFKEEVFLEPKYISPTITTTPQEELKLNNNVRRLALP